MAAVMQQKQQQQHTNQESDAINKNQDGAQQTAVGQQEHPSIWYTAME